jgi:hypothetical protein
MPGVRPALAWVRVWHVTYTYIKEALPRLLETLGGVDRYACKTAICPGPHLIALASFERHCRSSHGGARRGGDLTGSTNCLRQSITSAPYFRLIDIVVCIYLICAV